MTDEKSQKSRISHLVGNNLVSATGLVCQGKSAEDIKEGLVEKLKAAREKGTLIDEVVQIIGSYDWSSPEGVNRFRQAYLAFETKYKIGE